MYPHVIHSGHLTRLRVLCPLVERKLVILNVSCPHWKDVLLVGPSFLSVDANIAIIGGYRGG